LEYKQITRGTNSPLRVASASQRRNSGKNLEYNPIEEGSASRNNPRQRIPIASRTHDDNQVDENTEKETISVKAT